MITGLAITIVAILIGGVMFDVVGAMKANKTSPFKDVGKAGIAVLAAKEIFDIVTQNNKRGIGSGSYRTNGDDYGEKPY